MAIEVIINSGSGSVDAEATLAAVKSVFAAAGLEAVFHSAGSGEEMMQLAEKAASGDAEIIVAGGGDGTISGIASIVYEHKKILGVLPLGTLNNFSKDLQIPQTLDEAVNVIAEGNIETIDIGKVNGRTFINNSSIGLYPRIVRRREKKQQLGIGKWTAAFWSSLQMLKLSPFLKVRMTIGGKEFLRKTPFVFVGNNEYDIEFYKIGRRQSLTEGKLSVYFLHKGSRLGVAMLLFKAVFGGLKQWRDFEAVTTDSVFINTRRKRLHVAFDGEVEIMSTPLEYRIFPGSLKVIVPKSSEPEVIE